MAFRNRRINKRQEITPLINNYTMGYIAFKAYAFALLTALTVFITVMSSMNGISSGGVSGGIVREILEGFLKTFDINVDNSTFAEIYNNLHTVLRKLMHVSEFAALTICFFYTFEHIKYSIAISGIMAVIFAGMDEIHQYFIPGRVCAYTDVLIDSIGIIVSVMLLYILSRYVYQTKDKSLYIRTNGRIVK